MTSLSNLKVLIFWVKARENFDLDPIEDKVKNLRRLCPHLSINPNEVEKLNLRIADPNYHIQPESGIWDIYTKRIDMLPVSQSYVKHRGYGWGSEY